nr:hypothetical protein [Tanacetum cinerariifolium]
VQWYRIKCFNCKEFGHFAKECMKPKHAKDYAYHKEKMMLCKQEEKGVLLNVEHGDWLDDTDEEPDEQELEAHYMYIEKIPEHSEQPKTINDTYVMETVDSNVIPNSSNMYDDDEHANKNAKKYKDERVVLANLIANLKLYHDENKQNSKAIKANTSLTRKLNECKSALEESNDIRDRCRIAFHDQ